MSTNYYWTRVLGFTGFKHDELHIGKSSSGWCFALRVYPEHGIYDLKDWERTWAVTGSMIFDEYGSTVTTEEMRRYVTNRIAVHQGFDEDFLRRNYAEPGPLGLLRHRISNENGCVGHGIGTWDCVIGDFS